MSTTIKKKKELKQVALNSLQTAMQSVGITKAGKRTQKTIDKFSNKLASQWKQSLVKAEEKQEAQFKKEKKKLLKKNGMATVS